MGVMTKEQIDALFDVVSTMIKTSIAYKHGNYYDYNQGAERLAEKKKAMYELFEVEVEE
jgi:hypothetical protein